MRSRIYKIALTAFMGFAAYGAANAQTTPQEPLAAQTPGTATVSVNRAYSGTAYAVSPNVYYSYLQQPGDTVYRNKMKKLQEQIRALNTQMSELSREQSRKLSALNQERLAAVRKTYNLRFDSTMNRSFKRTFSSNFHFNYDNDSNIEKQVQSGEVKAKIKNLTKIYPVDANDKLQIENTYGKITVNTWPKNEIKVDVEIKAYANDDTDAQKLIDQTNILNSKENNVVSFKTAIDREDDSWRGIMTENGKITKVRKVVINYIVYMPVKSALNINNRYGTTILPALDGKITINNTYGKLDAKALSNIDNVINLKYVDANFTSLTGSDLKVAYGSLNLDVADNLNAQFSYSPVKIGKLNSAGNISLRYGDGLVISDVGKNLKTLVVNSAYAPVRLGSLNDINADFDVTVHNSEFLYNNAVNVTSKTPDNERGYTSTKTYKGHIGKGNAEKVITIKASYGAGVKFDQ